MTDVNSDVSVDELANQVGMPLELDRCWVWGEWPV